MVHLIGDGAFSFLRIQQNANICVMICFYTSDAYVKISVRNVILASVLVVSAMGCTDIARATLKSGIKVGESDDDLPA